MSRSLGDSFYFHQSLLPFWKLQTYPRAFSPCWPITKATVLSLGEFSVVPLAKKRCTAALMPLLSLGLGLLPHLHALLSYPNSELFHNLLFPNYAAYGVH